LTSGAWKRGMESLLRHRQTKGPETDKTLLNYRATPRLYTPGDAAKRATVAEPAGTNDSGGGPPWKGGL
jgi:hypothetical protein